MPKKQDSSLAAVQDSSSMAAKPQSSLAAVSSAQALTPVVVLLPPEMCSGCYHFMPSDVAETGLCRRYPPKESSQGLPKWPPVFPSSWCGEFKRK